MQKGLTFFLHLNIRSLYCIMKILISQTDPDILVPTETWFKQIVHDPVLLKPVQKRQSWKRWRCGCWSEIITRGGCWYLPRAHPVWHGEAPIIPTHTQIPTNTIAFSVEIIMLCDVHAHPLPIAINCCSRISVVTNLLWIDLLCLC